MTSDPPSFDELLNEAMERRGLSLARIRYHLRRRGHDLSVATLSYWRRGVARPTRATSLAAVVALEDVLELPAGVLTGSLIERLPPEAVGEQELEVFAAMLGLSWQDGLIRNSIHNIVFVDDDGRQVGHRIRETVVAQRAGVDRYPFVLWSEDELTRMSVETSNNCSVGRQLRSGSTLVAEICFPRALGVGERWMTDLAVTARVDWTDVGQWGWWVTTLTPVLHCTVMFCPGKVPRSAEVITELKGVTTTQPLVLRGRVLELHLQDIGPGTVDLRWIW